MLAGNLDVGAQPKRVHIQFVRPWSPTSVFVSAIEKSGRPLTDAGAGRDG